MTALLVAENLSRTLENEAIPVTLVRGAFVEIRSGEFTSITGPSGSGKSSLLYLLSLLDRPTTGKLVIDGTDTSEMDEDTQAAFRLEKLGFVFQSHFLLPEFSALENVMLPMKRLGALSEADIRQNATAVLERLGLEGHTHKLPQQMSGGQKQRTAIARALANDPMIVFADEPTGNLDSVSAAAVQNLLREIAHKEGRAVVAVTHDPVFADTADRRIHIVDGQIVR